MTRRRILVFIDYYLPGYKAGGPVQTLSGLVHHLAKRFEFVILTRDRDLGDSEPYREVPARRSPQMGPARCTYLAPSDLRIWRLRRLIKETPHDIEYANSLFSWALSIKPTLLRRLRMIPRRPFLIAPRGELMPGALKLSRSKKRIYLATARVLRLYTGVTWHASDEQEAEYIRHWFGTHADVRVAPILVAPPSRVEPDGSQPTSSGSLRIAFLSRISPKKNLYGALEIVNGVKTEVQFEMYGPREDADYWKHCQGLLHALPPNIKARYNGTVPHEQVHSLLAEHDLLLLPTLGENFGHVILEALVAGCPVLISDRTPWRGLEAREAGWDLPLDDLERFQQVIDRYARASDAEKLRRSRAAARLGTEHLHDEEAVQRNVDLFLARAID